MREFRTFLGLPPGVRSIPTQYRGTLYRSRTEAKWARAFHVLGITYSYEPDRYRLPSGPTYLPDFRLALSGDDHLWVEVKGPERLVPHDRRKIEAFVDAFGELAVLHGAPDEYVAHLWRRDAPAMDAGAQVRFLACRVDYDRIALRLGERDLVDVPATPFDQVQTYGEANEIDTLLAVAASYRFEAGGRAAG